MRDKLFNNNSDISDFCFDESVVAVFDDMVKRSVPGYEAMIQMVGLVAQTYSTFKNCSRIIKIKKIIL